MHGHSPRLASAQRDLHPPLPPHRHLPDLRPLTHPVLLLMIYFISNCSRIGISSAQTCRAQHSQSHSINFLSHYIQRHLSAHRLGFLLSDSRFTVHGAFLFHSFSSIPSPRRSPLVGFPIIPSGHSLRGVPTPLPYPYVHPLFYGQASCFRCLAMIGVCPSLLTPVSRRSERN